MRAPSYRTELPKEFRPRRVPLAARFYFEIANAEETIHDLEGVEAAGLEEALIEARSVIAEMVDEVTGGRGGPPWTLLVRNEAGWLVGRLPIRK
jgi:hypothetical protein